MADTSKPTCVIVPGAWHPESAYLDVSTHLQDAGYPVVVARLPSLNPDNPSASTCAVDGDAVRDILLSLIDDGKDIFLLNHSYGGVPGGAAAHGLSKAEVERQGKKGGVLGLVYMSSFVVPENLSLLDYLGGQHPPYLQKNQPSQDLCTITGAREVLFNNVDPAVASKLEESLLPHATLAFETPAPAPAWADPEYSGKIVFVKCLQDMALPLFVQDMFIQRSGVPWVVKELEAGHSPCSSHPADIVNIVHSWNREKECFSL
ncbi:MAG: hypothetical protein Q9190_000947 [Brigantiaea leucoxantha]